MCNATYVIRNIGPDGQDEPLYWSQTDGWVSEYDGNEPGADFEIFTCEEKEHTSLPIGAAWELFAGSDVNHDFADDGSWHGTPAHENGWTA